MSAEVMRGQRGKRWRCEGSDVSEVRRDVSRGDERTAR
jgi:hypothetical protein